MNEKFILPVWKVKPTILARALFLASGMTWAEVRAIDSTGLFDPGDS